MRAVRFELVDGPWLALTNNSDQLLYIPQQRAEWPEPPRLHGGLVAHHLSIPLTPRRDPPHAGKFWLHLKYRDGHRENVGAVDPERFRLGFEEIGAFVFERWLSMTHYAPPEMLVEADVEVLLPKPSLHAVVSAFLTTPKSRYQLDVPKPEMLDMYFERASPLALHSEHVQSMRCSFGLFCEGYPLPGSLAYFPDGLKGEPGGWYFTEPDYVTGDDLVDVFGRVFPGFWDKLYEALRELQAPVNHEKLKRVRAGLPASEASKDPV